MEEQDTTDVGQVDASQLNAPTPETAVADLTLAELNASLGKNFPDKDTALKSLKDTFSYVGKRIEDIRKEVVPDEKLTSMEQTIKKLETDMWFKDNPEHAPLRSMIEKMGKPQDVVNTPEYKTAFEKIKGYDEFQSKRTVLDSNPRLGQATDKMTEAKTQLAGGNIRAAQGNALAAVNEIFQNGKTK